MRSIKYYVPLIFFPVREFKFTPDPTPSKFLKLLEVCIAGVRDRILDKVGKEMIDKIKVGVN